MTVLGRGTFLMSENRRLAMTVKIEKYHILFYGGPEGYASSRSMILMYDDEGRMSACLRFCDPGMVYENDSEKDGVVYMHIPSHMFSAVVDVIRNEEPLYVYFAFGRGFLSTSMEPVGEGE